MNKTTPKDLGEIVIFNGEDGSVKVQIDTENETIWLNQKGIAELFGIDASGVSRHISNIYSEGELFETTTLAKIASVVNRGIRGPVTEEVNFYNLDMIIAVGYRINSKRATAFRQWATRILKEYLVKGFALDDERFAKGQSLSYFNELIDRIRRIRIEEKVFYQQVKDIYKLSIDYDSQDDMTLHFFKVVQNKLLWAVSGKTAAELVYYRSNSALPQMGMTSTMTKGVISMSDIDTGKNYLTKEELDMLKLIVEQYLSFAEAQAKAHRPMYMADWNTNLDLILKMNRKEILQGAGTISKELAKRAAKERYIEYKKRESLKELEEDIEEISKKKTN